uniref:Uncharacterized protein n=1 Tax=Rhodosorus marinus TaxID=101924 RepID=A0A7S3E791_9RHOD|mmetsp:Transcript_14603/g.59263  ORF Transcript_14603/g.59263 Transcript_14603/m.59263 type:complete len:108 (+) Transcript_14603:762-1085(+)
MGPNRGQIGVRRGFKVALRSWLRKVKKGQIWVFFVISSKNRAIFGHFCIFHRNEIFVFQMKIPRPVWVPLDNIAISYCAAVFFAHGVFEIIFEGPRGHFSGVELVWS